MSEYKKEAPSLNKNFEGIEHHLAEAYWLAYTIMEIEQSFGGGSALEEDAKQIFHNIRKAWDLVSEENLCNKCGVKVTCMDCQKELLKEIRK